MAWWEAGARILLAILIGLAIGYERERRNKPAGTRTHILVCLGAALIAVMENYVEARVLAINTDVLNTGVAVSMGRISAQVVSGIGFLGAGIIKIVMLGKTHGLQSQRETFIDHLRHGSLGISRKRRVKMTICFDRHIFHPFWLS